MKIFIRSATWALATVSSFFTFVSENVFGSCPLDISCELANFESLKEHAVYVTILINRITFFTAIWLIILIGYYLFLRFRWYKTIKGKNYEIRVEYGDIMKAKNSKRVINFDECYTSTVGLRPEDINENSLCGKYLKANKDLNINLLLETAGVKPAEEKSAFQQKTKYKPGTIVVNGTDLLLAFAPLDADGRGRFHSLKEYMECLSTMWNEIDKYYGQHDVCIPVLGSGVTRFETSGSSPTQQKLLDIIIWSYKLSPYKIKPPYKLRIMCQKRDGFSLGHIDCNN